MIADIPLPFYENRVYLPILYTVRRERHHNLRNDLFLFLRNMCEYDSLWNSSFHLFSSNSLYKTKVLRPYYQFMRFSP